MDQSITKDDYDRKLQELKDEQYRLNNELEEHTKADHNYSIHVSTVFDLCRRVKEIFVSSKTTEKRALLNYLLQNPVVEGKKFEFSLKSPFDLVLSLASEQSKSRALNPARTTWGQQVKDVRTCLVALQMTQ
ncbi:hypothetical protein HZA86_02035 [Candidatus Uhrbacteria bacterium]|nr:hypothetical protein [Candidatus Uhrbacteria bacterium]